MHAGSFVGLYLSKTIDSLKGQFTQIKRNAYDFKMQLNGASVMV